jgi:DNA mismatch repair protein MutS
MLGAARCRCCCRRPRAWREAHLAMDEATRASLEILASQQGGGAGSLIDAIDRCVTGAGARQLAEDLSAPLTDAYRHRGERLELVGLAARNALLREDLRAVLRALPDIGRALGRVVAGRGSPRDLGQLRDGLGRSMRRVHDMLGGAAIAPAAGALLPTLGGHGALVDLMSRALVPTPPTERGQGGFIAEGYDAALDELRDTAGNARRAIAALEARYRDRYRHRRAQDPAQRRARLFHRGARPPCRPADGARQRLHPPPDHGRRGALQRAGAARGSQPHRRGRRPCAGRRGGPFRGPGGHCRRRAARHRRAPPKRWPGSTFAPGRPNARPKAAGAGPRSSRNPASPSVGGRHPVVEAALARGANASSPTIAASPRTGCGWSAARTWAASPPSCARTR